MASHLRLLCCVLSLFAVQELPGAAGVYFSLDHVETKVDGQATCGVLHCREEVQPGSASIISSLTVYKQEAGHRVTLTTLSQQKPIDNGTFDGINVEGMWTAEKAEAKLSLVEKDDCAKVQFSCQVRFTDGEGKERVSSAVVGGEDVTTSDMTKDTPSPGRGGKSSVMSREVRSATDGACSMACEDKLQTMIESVKKTIKDEIASVKRTVKSDRWIVIQRRSRGDLDFHKNWDNYKKGFGYPDGDFWLGNNRIHALTSSARYELRITLGYKGKIYYANYDSFSISGENDNYRLHIGKYSGTAGDSLTFHNNAQFSTFDRDNDNYGPINLVKIWKGAWWHFDTLYDNRDSNLNGVWASVKMYQGLDWRRLTEGYSVTFSEMKIRPAIV